MILFPNELLNSPYAIALDPNAKKIYWGKDSIPWIIRCADDDGNNIEDVLVRPWVDPESLELDIQRGKMYWTDSFNDNIARANLDGSNYEDLGIKRPAPRGLALDIHNQYMYWTDIFLGRIERSFLNGNNVEILLAELTRPDDIVLDLPLHNMYWVEEGKQKHEYRIRKANLDGSNVRDILSGLNIVNGIALDLDVSYDYIDTTEKLTSTWAHVKSQ